MHKFCKAGRYDSAYVAKRLSNLARPIILGYRSSVGERHAARLNKEETEFRAVVRTLMSAGKWPSFRRLKRELSKPGILRNPKLVLIRKPMLGLGAEMERTPFGN
jgi:hypothetical protein